MVKEKIKAIIVDDHQMFRNGLKSLLEQEGWAKIIGEASNGQEFIEQLPLTDPDIILMDIDMPVMDGIKACEMALEKNKNLNILVLSMYDDYSHYSKMISLGVKGFISKSAGKTELEKGITAVSNGEYYFSSDLLRNIVVEIDKTKHEKESESDLTDRELEVLKLICNGYSTNEIADELFLSSKTIDNYRSKILQKTEVKNTVGLVIFSIKNGIIKL